MADLKEIDLHNLLMPPATRGEQLIFEDELLALGGGRHKQAKEVYFFTVGHGYFNPFAMSRISARIL